ncbi:bifunctional diguanylate cyclase/phosphodiesterase [Aureimonas sp. SA4125]|uniref:putative bifunctional diguanylate cyclase/phosphodiesterase n=1 Tax=Aureimonas sp. SA4125 TaxID=2826993 RepID=UPI001CC7B44C|nr:bifunctional diguanylate cyclase/phosphodiesterase [Aureimonas sp. SA4125]
MNALGKNPRQVMRLSYALVMVCLLASLGLAVANFAFPLPKGETRSLLAFGLAGLALLLLMRLHRQVLRLFADIARLGSQRNAEMIEDEITGALTRRAFLSICGEEMRRIGPGRTYAFLAIDMDYLKTLNDSLGHTTGDFALRHLVKVIRRSFPGAIVGRLGGDEFGVFTPMAGPEEAEAACRRCLENLRQTEFFDGRPMSLSASIGIAITPTHSPFFSELMECADLALYESKRSGRSQARLFDESFLRGQRQQRFIERELRAAILLDELHLVYQPLVDLTGAVQGYEALVRWRHSSRGEIPPGDFIPVAERSLLIDLLGQWVFRRALTDAQEFGDRPVWLNLSPSQLKRDDLVEMVVRTLAETGVAAERIVLELTESVAMNATPDMLRRLVALRDLGLRIALDDFGTGFCGFGYLRTHPIEIIKVDRSYIARLGESRADDVLVMALASVGSAMNLDIVAEGIETEAQFLLAKAAGCRLFQGFWIARPMCKADLLAWGQKRLLAA